MVLKRFNLTVMKKITVLSGLLLLAGLAAQAQERVAEYNVRPAVTVRTPLQGDSINFKGDKFTTGNLLKTKVSLDFDGGRYERMVADTAGYVTVAKADKDNLFYLFATNLRAERFMKGKLNVYSPARFEVFVNGESKQVKETAEDSLSQVRPTAVSLRMDPARSGAEIGVEQRETSLHVRCHPASYIGKVLFLFKFAFQHRLHLVVRA